MTYHFVLGPLELSGGVATGASWSRSVVGATWNLPARYWEKAVMREDLLKQAAVLQLFWGFLALFQST